MTVQEIRDAFKYGDIRQVAVLSGYSESMVKKVLNPSPKKGQSRKNEKIMGIAIKLAITRLKERKAFLKQVAALESV